MEYLTTYPKTISFFDGLRDRVKADGASGVEQLTVVEMKKGLIAIQAEVEVSRDYLQHLFCQRTPVIYEIESLMKKYQIDYKIWNNRIRKYVKTIFDNYKIKLNTPNIPVLAWKPLVFVIVTVGSFYLWKYIQTI